MALAALIDLLAGEWRVAALVILLCSLLWSWINSIWLSPLAKIPGPSYGPLYGNVKEAARGEAMETSVSWVKKYGGLVRFYHFFGRQRLLVADVASIKHVLVTNSRNYVRRTGGYLQWLMPWGLLSVEGMVHRQQKKLMAPSFSSEAVRHHVCVFRRKAAELARKALAMAMANQSQGEVNVQRLLRATTLDVICLTAFSHDIKALDDPDNEEVRAVTYVVTRPLFGLVQSLPLPLRLPLPSNRKLWRYRKLVDNLVYSIIDDRKRQQQNTAAEAGSKGSLLDQLLRAKDDSTGEAYTDEQLRDQILTFLLAGHETTSITMTWLLLELARHPDVQDRVVEEVKFVFPTEDSMERATVDDYDRLTYLTCCIKETLRLYTPAASLLRTAVSDDLIKGYRIPAGTTVVVHLGAMMRTAWPNGDCFAPERFADPDFEANAWLPFAIGPHACVGNKFAMLEMKAIISSLLLRLRFAVSPSRKFIRKNIFLVVPYPDVTLLVSRRDGSDS